MTAVLDLSTLTEAHKTVSCSSLPVTGRTEAGDVAQFQQPGHDFIQAAVVAYIKLSRVFFRQFFGSITSHAGAGTTADL